MNDMAPRILASIVLVPLMAVVGLTCRRKLVLGPTKNYSISKLIPQICLPDPELGVSFIELDLRLLFWM